MKRRILHIADALDSKSVAEQLVAVAIGASGDEFETHLALLTPEPRLATSLAGTGVAFLQMPTRHALDPVGWWQLVRHIGRLHPTIVHAWSPRADRFGGSAAMTAGVDKVVLSRRNVEPSASAMSAATDRILSRRAAAIVVNSRAVERCCRSCGVPAKKVRLIPSGVRPGAAATVTRDQLLAELGLPADARLIGTVGALTRGKRVKDLIWAADLLKVIRHDVHLLVIGDGPHRDVLHRYRRLCRIEDKVHFLGEREDVDRWLPHLDVYWLASAREGLSGGLMRALACGVPAVASDIESNRELVVHGQSGFLVPTGDRANLARYAHKILEDATLAQRLGQAARQHMAEDFNMAAMVDRHAALYRELGGGA
jgi:glycosyltransferase involved in cell wall biosynthesis